jgi:ubiquinone/menaquinone biosynthesis C-methylase UbiE
LRGEGSFANIARVTLVEHCLAQRPLRNWQAVLARAPDMQGKVVLDLGCAIGDQAALLGERGARVVGVDGDDEAVRYAQRRGIPRATFLRADLRQLPFAPGTFDGLWASFVAAYFVDFEPVLRDWTRLVRRGGFLLITEVDDLFGHEPKHERATTLLRAYAQDGLAAARYDFFMGRKLSSYLRRAGWTIVEERCIADRELAFDGPADAHALQAWQSRFAEMRNLQAFCGDDFALVRDSFVRCLQSAEHRASAQVRCCIARRL